MSECTAARGALEIALQDAKVPGHTDDTPKNKYRREISTPQFKAVGILYAKLDANVEGGVRFEIFYESHIEQIVKDEIKARFGIGAHEWRCQ